MQGIVDTQITRSLGATLEPALRVGALSDSRTEAWRQRLVNLTLIFSDLVLALFMWEIVLCAAQILWAPVISPGDGLERRTDNAGVGGAPRYRRALPQLRHGRG